MDVDNTRSGILLLVSNKFNSIYQKLQLIFGLVELNITFLFSYDFEQTEM